MRLVKVTKLVPDPEPANFSGSYNDLTDKPTIPSNLSDLNDNETHRLVTDSEKSTWNNKLSSISKENVEAVLTGEISTHTHADSGRLTQAQILARTLGC